MKNWIVRFYDYRNNVEEEFEITDRTEQEAESEASSEFDRQSENNWNLVDWSLTERNERKYDE